MLISGFYSLISVDCFSDWYLYPIDMWLVRLFAMPRCLINESFSCFSWLLFCVFRVQLMKMVKIPQHRVMVGVNLMLSAVQYFSYCCLVNLLSSGRFSFVCILHTYIHKSFIKRWQNASILQSEKHKMSINQWIQSVSHNKNKAIVDSRLRPQSCWHLANCIEMQEIVDCKLDANNE